jgi:hypothetical protein
VTLLVLAATLRRKPPARATRLAIRGLVGSEVVCDAEKFNVNVCNVVPSYDKITLTGPAVFVVMVKFAAPVVFDVTFALDCPAPVELDDSALIRIVPEAALAVTKSEAFATGLPFASFSATFTVAFAFTVVLDMATAKELFAASSFGGQSPAMNAAPLGLPRPDAMS